jgi:dCTP deaminase
MMNSGILSGDAISGEVEEGGIQIDPYNKDQLNPASYDLTLGDEVAVYTSVVYHNEVSPYSTEDGRCFIYGGRTGILDAKTPQEVAKYKMDPIAGWVLKPGIGYLMHTRERVHTNNFVPVLDGKSSIGRLFIKVHETAGYGDPGFNGQYTLEVTCVHPVQVYPGMRICQIRFHTISGHVGKTYDKVGHYTNENAKGAVASQAWRQFEK